MKNSPEAITQGAEKESAWDLVPDTSRALLRELLGPYLDKKDILESKAEDYELLENEKSKLLEAKQLGLIGTLFKIRQLIALATMEESRFENLKRLAKRFPEGKTYHLLDSPECIDAINPTDPRSPAVEELMQVMDAGYVKIALRRQDVMDRIMAAPSPKEWVIQRAIVHYRFQKLAGKENLDERKFLMADERLLPKLEKLDDTPLRRFAATYWPNLTFDDEEMMDDLLSTWGRLMTPDIEAIFDEGDQKYGNDLTRFFHTRPSWQLALADLAGAEALRGYLSDPEALKSFVMCEINSKAWVRITPEQEAELENRPKLPLDSDDPRALEEMEDVLALSGMRKILKRCIERLRLVTTDVRSCRGTYSSLLHEITVVTEDRPELKPQVPGTLFHEAGHAVEDLLAIHEGCQTAFDRYSVGVIFSDAEPTSEYPAAIAKISGKSKYRFLSEQFAEDFRLLLEFPAFLPKDRLKNLESIFIKAFPDVRLDELQSRIRKMFGSLYGTNAKDLQVPVNCDTISDFAERYARRSSEAYREARESKDA